jgi:hypothetical protein
MFGKWYNFCQIRGAFSSKMKSKNKTTQRYPNTYISTPALTHCYTLSAFFARSEEPLHDLAPETSYDMLPTYKEYDWNVLVLKGTAQWRRKLFEIWSLNKWASLRDVCWWRYGSSRLWTAISAHLHALVSAAGKRLRQRLGTTQSHSGHRGAEQKPLSRPIPDSDPDSIVK